jgi:SM-20-related protein
MHEQKMALPNWQVMIDDATLDEFVSTGFMVLDNCFCKDYLLALQTESGCLDYELAHLTAGERISEIRGDRIRWIDERCPAGMVYLSAIGELAGFFNQTLYAGIRHWEAHYAHYPTGFGYQWHSDNPMGRDERVISAVFYLNEDWQAADGGEVLLIDKKNNLQTRAPKANRLLVFDSNLRHQVNITHRNRFSIATWMRKDSIII